jgi:hypothetical protein
MRAICSMAPSGIELVTPTMRSGSRPAMASTEGSPRVPTSSGSVLSGTLVPTHEV